MTRLVLAIGLRKKDHNLANVSFWFFIDLTYYRSNNYLKIKAGLPPTYWSGSICVERYATEVI